jgi:hypothetical protein
VRQPLLKSKAISSGRSDFSSRSSSVGRKTSAPRTCLTPLNTSPAPSPVNASRLIPKNAYTLDNNSNRLPKISRLVSVQGGPGDIAARSRRTGDEPGPTGSALLVMTIGMVVVAFMAATVPGLDPVTTMSRRAGPEPQQARAAVPARRSRSGTRWRYSRQRLLPGGDREISYR